MSQSQKSDSQRCRAEVTLKNRNGMHARPAHLFVQTANAYAARLQVGRADSDERVDGKSIMGLMMLAAERGTVLVLSAEGPDAEQQVRAIEELIAANFGEE
jgi:phosphocarrier protein